MIDSADSTLATVSIWTPWGEQKVQKLESRTALLRRAVTRMRGSDELPSVPDFSDRAWPAG